MGEEASPPLPVCDRCHHFVVRDRSVATCGPCRKAYQLGVSLRNVIPPGKDESAVVFLEGCFSLLQDWITEIKGLTAKEKAAKEKKSSQEDKPQEKPQREEKEPVKSDSPRTSNRPVEASAKTTRDPQPPRATRDQHPATPVRPSGSSSAPSRLPLPPPPPNPATAQGSASRGYSSQTVRIPRPSHGIPEPRVERPETKVPTTRKGRSDPLTGEEEVAVESEEHGKAKREKSRRRRRRERSSSSPSSRGREKKRRRREKKEKKEKDRRRKRTPSGSSSVTGPRVREAKRGEAPRPKSPARPRSPHTPPGPPPAPPPVRQPPVRAPPVRPPRRPAARQGPGWIGRVPYSNHPRWWAGKNKGVTRRAKQELFNRRR